MINRVKQWVGFLFAVSLVSAVGVNAQPARAIGQRPALEQQLRQRMAAVTQQRLALTDAQMAELEQSNSHFAPQLTQLIANERETRQQLRLELTSPTPNQQHVSTLIDQSINLQKQRVALVESEQRDLARFMTPVQRAQYVALQTEFRRRAQEMVKQNSVKNQDPVFRRRGLKKLP